MNQPVKQLRHFDDLDATPLWSTIEARTPGPEVPPPVNPIRRVLVVVAALAIFAVAGAFAWSAFDGRSPAGVGPGPDGSGLPSNGSIWVRVGGGDGPSFVYQVNPTTGVATPLFNDGQAGSDLPGTPDPAAVGSQYEWSPDGSRVVFSGWSEDKPYHPVLYTMDPNGSQPTPVRGSDSRSWGVGAFSAYPSWSPDGMRIAYARAENSDVIVNGQRGYIPGCETSPFLCRSQIHVIDAIGGNDKQVTHELISASMPDWSPDGRSIVFVSSISEKTTRIGVVGADGGSPTFLTNGSSEDLLPRWSPDGLAITFLSDRSGKLGLYSVPSDGGPVTLISDVGGTALPSYAWSPDGTEIAVSDGEALLILAADGTVLGRVDIAHGYDVGDVAWRPASSSEATASQITPSPSGVSPTTSTPQAASAVLSIACQTGGAGIADQVVEAQQDGVHIDVSNPSDARFLEFHAVDDDSGSAFSNSADGRSISHALSPGEWVVGCIQHASQSTYGDVPTAEFQVVDPRSFWVEPGLDCTSPTSERTGDHYSVDGAKNEENLRATAEAQLSGVQDTDVFQGAGYVGTDWIQWQYWGILVRDGQRIAAVKLNYDGAGMTVESCVPDVHRLGA